MTGKSNEVGPPPKAKARTKDGERPWLVASEGAGPSGEVASSGGLPVTDADGEAGSGSGPLF